MGVTVYGGPEALHEADVEPEDLGPGQLRIRVLAAGVNPTDTQVRSGARADGSRAETVDVPGMDICGTVVQIGPETSTDLTVGDRVVGIVVPSGEHGAYRDEVVIPAASVVPAPSEASDAEAATLLMNALTARVALDRMGLTSGDTVAVTGSAGAFGGYVVQLAVADGLRVIADAKEGEEELVRGLGAQYVVPRGSGFADAVRELAPDGADGLADGSVQGAEAVSAVKDDGAVATIRGWQGDGQRAVSFHPVMVFEHAEDHDRLAALREAAEAGALTLRVADVLPAGQAAEAHRRLEAGGVRGRLVLDFS